ncbi:hypothetical protein GE09DRAFT_1164076 [Coniochaeta sp. 2T2.1]|nr:hypothetical protein GE09DRAFT_1164076 [Coniochaeta sp. 2T2.1]
MSNGPGIHQRPDQICSSRQGHVYYTPRTLWDGTLRANTTPTFPAPRIRPRQRRPQSIHIVTYPPGYVPHDLRPLLGIGTKESKRVKRAGGKGPLLDVQFGHHKRRKSLPIVGDCPNPIGKLLARLALHPKSHATPALEHKVGATEDRPLSTDSTALSTSNLPDFDPAIPEIESPTHEHAHDDTMVRAPTTADQVRPQLVTSTAPYRSSLMSVRSAKSIVSSSVTEVNKPVASGSGVSCSIILAEPNVFLTGFDHDGHEHRGSQNATALLRGKLHLSVSKNVKIKAITLKLTGKARTEWPEGIPPLKVDMFEEETLRAQSLVFFHAMHENMWATEFGNQCTVQLKNDGTNRKPGSPNASMTSLALRSASRSRAGSNLSAREIKRLSLQSVNSRSFGKGDNPAANAVQAKGYKVFYPGTYDYSFELPIDHHQLETTRLQYGHVKWELEATIERAGAFKPNLHGTKEVAVVRVPDQLSLEMSEPISISRQWEDQMHYDIMISGKSFPIGAKIPIAFKLTPLAKVQIHKLKVFVTESIEYWTNDRRVTRKDPGRKILLLEKTAGKSLDPQYEASEVRTVSGGELSREQREEARRVAERRRVMEAARTNRAPDPLPELSENLLGDLDLGLETFWGSTEMEMNVQIPTCEMMAKDKTLRLHPDCSWKNVNVYHWIKLVMRISRADPEDPTGKRRRHFEISIDSPFTVLDCRATQANTALPQYCGRQNSPNSNQMQTTCGCPDAKFIPRDASPSSSTGTLAMNVSQESLGAGNLDRVNTSALPMAPQAAHLQPGTPTSTASPLRRVQNSEGVGATPAARPHSPVIQHRPMELLRLPSYNPPPFDADEPPPRLPVETPPPNYDIIVGTPSVDGLADYFSRLADYEDPANADDVHPAVAGHATDMGIVAPIAVTPTTDPVLLQESPSTDGAETETEDVGYMTRGRRPSAADTVADGGDDDSDTDSGEDGPARIHRGGRVNIANPRTPGGRRVTSRSLDLERPAMQLSLAGVIRRGERR